MAVGTEKENTEKKKGRGFWVTFLIAFVAFVVVLIPVNAGLNSLGESRLFQGGDGEKVVLEEELSVLIPGDSRFFEAFKNADRANVLLIGANQGMTDTLMLFSFDKKNKHVDVISIPRDTYYHREGHDGVAERKINAAYRGNPINTAKAVSETLMGIPINYYAVIDYDGVEKIVDSMGGVPMTIAKPMKYRDPYDKPPLVIDIPAGDVVLDGKHAVQFLRFRHDYAEGDLGRVKAQQEFVKSAFKQCLGFDLPKIAKTVFENVNSDITLKVALGLATKAVGITGDDITTYMMPNTPESKPPYYVYPKKEEIITMLETIYSIGSETTTDSAVTSD